MKVPTGVLKLTVGVPVVVASCLLWVVALALPPPALGLLAFLAGAAALALLVVGVGERMAILVLAGARRPTPGEEAALRTVAARLASLRIAAGREVLVRRSVRPRTPPAQLLGGDALVVTPWLIEAAHRGWLPLDETVALVVHADARRRVERPRAEVAMLALTLPSRAIVTLGHGVSRAVAWVPLLRFAWAVRCLVGGVAVIQQVAAGRGSLGVFVGVIVVLSYLVPAAARAHAVRVESAADAAVVRLGLGPALAATMDRYRVPLSLERSQRLHAHAPAARGTQGHRHLELFRN